jgi:hypothetical protein
MERSEILSTMSELKLYGMKAAYDEIIGTAVKRQREPARIVGDRLTAEISEKQARSIRYQITIAKLPLAKDVDDFAFDGTPTNQTLVRDLAGGEFLAHQRNVVLVGGTGTGKTHLAIAIARACIRDGALGRFFSVVDLVNRLEAEARSGRQGRMAEYLCRMDFVVLDELGYLPFVQSGGQLRSLRRFPFRFKAGCRSRPAPGQHPARRRQACFAPLRGGPGQAGAMLGRSCAPRHCSLKPGGKKRLLPAEQNNRQITIQRRTWSRPRRVSHLSGPGQIGRDGSGDGSGVSAFTW